MKHFLLIVALLLIAPNAFATKVQEIKTPAGFTVWLVEEHSLPIITSNISFAGSGTAYDPAGKEGRTNMVAALLMEGAHDRDSNAFNATLEDNAIRLNVGTDDDAIIAMLSTLSDRRDIAFSMLADALIRPRFDADAIARTRNKMQVLLVEQAESPSYKLSRGFQESIYGTHPYARMGVGTKESLELLNKNDFQDYTQRYLTRENIIISVVGDTTPEEISTLLDKNLRDLPLHYTPDSVVEDIQIAPTPDTRIIKHMMPQTMIAFGLPGLKRKDPDYIPGYVMNYMLGGNGLHSLLAKELRIKHGLTYGINTQLVPKMHTGVWRGMFATQNAQAKDALTLLTQALGSFDQSITKDALSDAQAYLTGSFMLDLSSNQEVANFLTMMQTQKLGSDYLEKRNGLIEHVTLEDIRRVSKRLIDPAKLRIVMVGSPES